MWRELMTRVYLAFGGRANAILRRFDLLLMAEFEGEPPERPFTVRSIWIQRQELPANLTEDSR